MKNKRKKPGRKLTKKEKEMISGKHFFKKVLKPLLRINEKMFE